MRQGQPFIKWVGSKRELIPDLLPYVPQTIRTYFEPFMGGAALFWKLASERRFETAQISDLNTDLVTLYGCIKNNPYFFILEMERLALDYRNSKNPRVFYENIRSKIRDRSFVDLDRAVWFLFLNKTCFNGLYRTNKKGEFNSPWGKNVDVNFLDAENIQTCSDLLQNVQIHAGSYSRVLGEAQLGDFVYFDPPYIPVSKTADFTSYTSEDFDMEAQKTLARDFRDLSSKGVHVMLSNSDVPEIRELYDGFEIKIVRARRSINSKAEARGPVNEVLVLGKGLIASERSFDLLAELDQEF